QLGVFGELAFKSLFDSFEFLVCRGKVAPEFANARLATACRRLGDSSDKGLVEVLPLTHQILVLAHAGSERRGPRTEAGRHLPQRCASSLALGRLCRSE